MDTKKIFKQKFPFWEMLTEYEQNCIVGKYPL